MRSQRFKSDLLPRVKRFAHRVVDVAQVLEEGARARRIIDQLIGSGTSVAANVAEASESMSRADFCKTLNIALKEVAETVFWLEFVAERNWLPTKRLEPLLAECEELRKILGTIITRTRKSKRTPIRKTTG